MSNLQMKCSGFRWHLLVCALALCFSHLSSLAATSYSCSAPTFSIATATYDPFASLATLTGTVSLSCSKNKNDPTSMAYTLSINQGANAVGGLSYASVSGGTVQYNLLRSASAADPWSSTSTISGSMLSWSSSGNTRTGTASVNFSMQIPAGQASAYTSGSSYADSRIVTLNYPNAAGTGTTAVTGLLPIAINIPAKCVLSSPPGSINFSYTSFQSTALQPSTSFAVSCATNTQYTMALDATSGTIVGLNYSLALNKSGTQVGTYAAQNVNITGAMAAGQSGQCTGGCTQTQTRTLTISY